MQKKIKKRKGEKKEESSIKRKKKKRKEKTKRNRENVSSKGSLVKWKKERARHCGQVFNFSGDFANKLSVGSHVSGT